MSNRTDVVAHVEVAAALDVDQVAAPTSFDLRRVCVVVVVHTRNAVVPTLEPLVFVDLGSSDLDPEQCGRIWANLTPRVGLGGWHKQRRHESSNSADLNDDSVRIASRNGTEHRAPTYLRARLDCWLDAFEV